MDSTTLIEIKELADGLPEGSSRRRVCPWCGGGDKQERSFVVRATESGIHYSCYRATCPGHNGKTFGHIGGRGIDRGFAGIGNTRKDYNLDPYLGPLEPLPGRVLRMFRRKFDLTAAELASAGFKWAPEDDRVYMPVYGPQGQKRGGQLRSYNERVRTKVLARQEKPAPWQAWYKLGTGRSDGLVEPRTLVVVEDQVSALKVSRHFNSVAFLGTKITPDRIQEIAAIGARDVVVALDADAQDKAIDIINENMLLFERIHVAFLGKDFKDVPDAEIIERVKAAIG